MESMELIVQLTEADYVKGGRFILHRKTGGRLMYLFLVLCAVVGILGGLLARGGPQYWEVAFGAGFLIVAGLIWYSPVMHVRGNLRVQPEAFAPNRWTLDEAGLRAT